MLEFLKPSLLRMKFFGILSIVLAVFCALAQSEMVDQKFDELNPQAVQPQVNNADIPNTQP